jgi:hypothetical protein
LVDVLGGEGDLKAGPEATAALAGFLERGVAELVGMLQNLALLIRGKGADGFQYGMFQGYHDSLPFVSIMLLSLGRFPQGLRIKGSQMTRGKRIFLSALHTEIDV